jgi:anion-transporting  ArsA/GET3 family ATPase
VSNPVNKMTNEMANEKGANIHSIHAIIARRRIIVTCGTGGVGKTTLSAAIALKAALEGKRAVVITIDPAKRLATSLGLEKLSDDPTDLTDTLREACRKTDPPQPLCPTGKLYAIVPDTRRTLETFIRSLASTPAGAERVMRNPIFHIFAKEFSGTNEYMALERLYALSQERTEDGKPFYDLIVLDTPPSRNTQAFLEAPSLLARFFEEKLIRWIALPANRLMAAGVKKALNVLERLTGAGFMTSLMDFAAGLFQVQATFTANLKKVMALLESEEVGFIMVTTPSPGTAPDVKHFVRQLAEKKMNFDGIAINRSLRHLDDPTERAHEKNEAPRFKASPAAERLLRGLIDREKRVIQELRESAGDAPVCSELPELARDVHSIEDLLHVAIALAPTRL